MRFALALSAALALFAAPAFAGEKSAAAGSTCEAGIGKPVCCKAMVADHCGYVSCCEVGNAAFHTAKACHAPAHAVHVASVSSCTTNAKQATAKASGSCCAEGKDKALYVSACEVGNASFFKASHASCCSAKAKAK
jgi:hypothetical protein